MIVRANAKPLPWQTTAHAQCIHTKGDRRIERPDILTVLMLEIQVVWDVVPC
jgi:hypothetical protein